jgi:2-dehydropantoate 2-reductase
VAFERLAILGTGAIGSTIGAYLTRAQCDVTLIDLWPAHVEAMRARGLTLTAENEEFTVPVSAIHLAEACTIRAPFDAIVLSVKSYDSVWAAHFLRPLLSPAGVVILAQNGINEDLVAPIVGYSRTVGCVVTFGAAVYEPGHALRTGSATQSVFALGELNGMVTPRIDALVKVLSPVGPTHATTNLWGERWAKLTVNCMANALAGITGLDNAQMRQHAAVFPITLRVAGEALTIAERLGVQVEPVGGVPAREYLDAARGIGADAVHRGWIERGRSVGAGRPSLLQDVLKGRRTEVDHLNGYVVAKGREVGVPTPINQAIVEVTHRVERGELAQSPANLELLTRA